MSVCLICLGELEPRPKLGSYHRRCLRELFGTTIIPQIDVEIAKLHTIGLAMVGKISLSGVQRKISLGLSDDRKTLQVALGPNRYILKPQTETYPSLPENEHVTMKLAALVGIEVPPCGLFHIKDGSMAYLVQRFDRLPTGRKLRQEDFCQLAEKSPKEKYEGSAELCARLVRQYASEPGIEMWKLYRLLLFNWWVGNGDAHLKNFSLLAGLDGLQKLSPAYDLVGTRLVIPNDPLALPVGGKKDGLTRDDWLALADYCEIPPRAEERMLLDFVGALARADTMIGRSALPESMKTDYGALIRSRTESLRA
jgi:serine/threonine-protein kinase HipA